VSHTSQVPTITPIKKLFAHPATGEATNTTGSVLFRQGVIKLLIFKGLLGWKGLPRPHFLDGRL